MVLMTMTMTMIIITDAAATFDVRSSPCFCSLEESLLTMMIVLLLLWLLMLMTIILVGTAKVAELLHTNDVDLQNTTYLSNTEDGATSTTTGTIDYSISQKIYCLSVCASFSSASVNKCYYDCR